METQKILNNKKKILNKKYNIGGIIIPDFKLQNHSNKKQHSTSTKTNMKTNGIEDPTQTHTAIVI
jgi:hypothetical protein